MYAGSMISVSALQSFIFGKPPIPPCTLGAVNVRSGGRAFFAAINRVRVEVVVARRFVRRNMSQFKKGVRTKIARSGIDARLQKLFRFPHP